MHVIYTTPKVMISNLTDYVLPFKYRSLYCIGQDYASERAFAMASMMPLLLYVALDTISTFALCADMTLEEIVENALLK